MKEQSYIGAAETVKHKEKLFRVGWLLLTKALPPDLSNMEVVTKKWLRYGREPGPCGSTV